MMRRALWVTVGMASAVVLVACGSGAPESASEPGFGRCEITASAPVAEIATVAPDVLTLATPLPFPVAYATSDDGRVDGGYLYCLGAEIAHRAGLGGVTVVERSFTDITAGAATEYDVSLVDATVTPERAAVVSFAAPYGANTSGVLARAGAPITEAAMSSARIAVVESSLQQSALTAALPEATIAAYASPGEVAAAVASGDVEAGVLDTALALVEADASQGALAVIAEYAVGGDLAPVLPRGSPEVEAVSAIIESMRADGTLDAIRARWLSEDVGAAVSPVPEWSLP